MSSNRHKFIRGLDIVLLVLLVLQFEFGMAVNISNPPAIPPPGFSLGQVSNALHQAGGAALPHAILGACLVMISVINLILSLRTGNLGVQISGTLAFIATFLAASLGLVFTLSGFKNDNYSHGMATNFILSYSFYFLELYFLKPGSTGRDH